MNLIYEAKLTLPSVSRVLLLALGLISTGALAKTEQPDVLRYDVDQYQVGERRTHGGRDSAVFIVVASRDGDQRGGKKSKRWENLTPEQRAKLDKRRKQFESLPPEEKEKIRKAREHYRDLPSDQRKELREKWRSMTPEERREQRNKMKGSPGHSVGDFKGNHRA